jgi:hypothetical protein
MFHRSASSIVVWIQNIPLPAMANQKNGEGRFGLDFNNTMNKHREASPTTTSTIRTSHNKKLLVCATASNVIGSHIADGYRIAAYRMGNTQNPNRNEKDKALGFSWKRIKDVKTKKLAAANNIFTV